MRLMVKQSGRTINEFRFTKGPIHIGRHADSQVLLPDRKISRQHATIFSTQEGRWIVKDLDSANKTYLNDKAIHEAEVKTGDRLRMGDFTVGRVDLEDTLTTAIRQPQTIVRKLDTEHAPDIRLPAKRARDFVQATEAICRANGPEEVLKVLLKITATQLDAYHCWCALRNEPEGPMTCHAGKRRDGQKVQLGDIKLHEKINQVVESSTFLLLPRVPQQKEQQIQSAMIVPITGASGCFGVMYVDNDTGQQQFNLSDLDYLMLLAVHTAAILENF